ncbi:hypothetical protein KZZ52_50990 [Dactylosporangium sp. AC04546]|uniref:hypothetical protein n=1 Tax=Dactylosporangium sp. AC04546 TaxID=2862460 RepID=UPI001EDDA9CC|nr:hypothetical protein [Dactylosporangium sp. AC04546]WVK82197.1 hypothetical protein KZZ52_50990 [Dactylosporangium sp. AC04546]
MSRLSYEQRRPWTLPDTLDELRGPTHGVVCLPNHLDWSEQRVYDLDNPKHLGVMYEIVIRESTTPADQRRYLDGPTLRAVWHRLWLPRFVRELWESRFPELRVAGH